MTENHPAQYGADQRPGDQRTGGGRTQSHFDTDGRQHKAEDQQVKAVHGVAGDRSQHGFAGRGVVFCRCDCRHVSNLFGLVGGPIVPWGAGRHQIKTAVLVKSAEFGL
ncbi:hypothetical protein D3C76_1273290 [compost metagenome]